METRKELPKWLDSFIYNELGAKYSPTGTNMTVIDWNREDMLTYLGTYFPRSYTESYCIFSDHFTSHSSMYADKNNLSIFDFCCGTGGEIIGLLSAIEENLANVKSVRIYAHDGNNSALRLFEKVLLKFKKQTSLQIEYTISCVKIYDLYDLEIINKVITDTFDIAMSFKAICEFIEQERLDNCNVYTRITNFLIPRMNENGTILLEDITTKSKTQNQWFPIAMDNGLKEANVNITEANPGFNQTFTVSHSQKQNDTSKVAWRIMTVVHN